MRNAHCRTWNMARIFLKSGKCDKKQFQLEYGEKYFKKCKIRMHTVATGVWGEN